MENTAGVLHLLDLLGGTFVDPNGSEGALALHDGGYFLNGWAWRARLSLGIQLDTLASAEVESDLVNTRSEFTDTAVFVVREAEATGSPPERIGDVDLTASPNPFNPRTTLRFTNDAPGRTTLVVFDARGREVRRLREGYLPAGTFQSAWDGRDDRGDLQASGVYFVRLHAPDRTRGGVVRVTLTK